MNTTRPLPVHKLAWAFISAVVWLVCLDFFWQWPMSVFSRLIVCFFISAGSVFVGWLLQFLWGFLVSILPKSPHRPLKQKIFVWVIRAVYISVFLAMCDICSLSTYRRPLFSYCPCMTGNGDAIYYGFGYDLVNHADTYRDGGKTLGPEVWFWFTPFIIDAAHGGIQIHRDWP